MSSIEFTREDIKQISDDAFDLFHDQHCIFFTNQHGNKLLRIFEYERFNIIVDIIGDSGLVYLSVWEQISYLWESIRSKDELGLANWFLQTSTDFRIRNLPSQDHYEAWIDHLARCYSSFRPETPQQLDFGHHNKKVDVLKQQIEKSIAVDDVLHERLPEYTEFQSLLYSNLWLVYILTLRLNYHRITQEILSNSRSWIRENVSSEET